MNNFASFYVRCAQCNRPIGDQKVTVELEPGNKVVRVIGSEYCETCKSEGEEGEDA